MSLRQILLLVLLVFSGLAAYTAYSILRPYQGYAGETFVDVRRGADTLEIAGQLEQASVLRAEWPFLVIRVTRPRSRLKAGEYRFDRPLSPLEVYRKIAAGDVFYYSVTIPEGHSMFEIAEAVARTGVLTRQQFLAEAAKAERIADFAPNAHSLEGFLFPDTYRLTRHTTAEELVGQMIRRFREVYGKPNGNVLAAVTLASLVEKETAVAAERPLVASVFRNRLRIGMPLQCDPTVIYALQLAGRYSGTIHKDDLGLPSPYNTYARPGLPPGPIGNPGRASLHAALAPAETDYLYFVADSKGGHVFSANLDRHSKAVASYVHANRRHAQKKNRGR